MYYKCLLCFMFVVLPIECLFKGDSCTADNRRSGTCKQLSKCTHLMTEIRRCGTPMPSHMREKLKRLGCGFELDEPLVCCDSSSNTAHTQKPITSRPNNKWGSGEYEKEDPYNKGPQHNAGDKNRPGDKWGSGEYEKEYSFNKGPHHNTGDKTRPSNKWGFGEFETEDPYDRAPHHNVGEETRHGDKWGSGENEKDDPYDKNPYYNAGDKNRRGDKWGFEEYEKEYPYNKGPHHDTGDKTRPSDKWAFDEYDKDDPYDSDPHYNVGDKNRRGDKWGSSEYEKDYPYNKVPHHNTEDKTRPSDKWGFDEYENDDPYDSDSHYNVGDKNRPSEKWGSGEYEEDDPYNKGRHYNAGDKNRRGDKWGSGEYEKEYPYNKDPQYNTGDKTRPGGKWGSGEYDKEEPYNKGRHNAGDKHTESWTTSKPNSNPWGSSEDRDNNNTGGVTDPYTNTGGGNRGDSNNTWNSDKNTEDNTIGRIPDVRNHRNLNLLPTECGAIEGERIFGGNRTRLFEMPWMVLLSYDSARGTKLSCGGTLITEWYVLTAAHCISNLGTRLKLRSVILGEYDVRRDPDCERMEGELFCAPKVRNVAVGTLIPHPNYTPQKLGDDIGLIRLSEPADFTLDSMKPICLPTTPELQSEKLEGLNGVVAGWGATEDGLQSPVLLSVDLPIISNSECQAIYNGSPVIDESQLCAGGVPDKDSCGGDSGGPLLYPGRTKAVGVRYVQRGIVSYGSKRCGLGGFPGVYTRVANYMEWILDSIRG